MLDGADIFFFLVPGMFVLFGLFLLLLWNADRTLKAGLWGALAFAIGGIGVLIDALRQPDSEWLRYLTLGLHFLTVGLFLQAFARRKDETVPRVSIGIAFFGMLLFFPYLPPDPTGTFRFAIVETVVFAMIVPILPRAARWRDGSAAEQMILGILWVAALSYAIRVGLSLGMPDLSPRGAPLSNVHIVIFHLSSAVVGFGMGLTLLFAMGTDAVRRENRQSATDPLTALGNRRRLDWAIGADEQGSWECGSAIVLDLDHFKSVNDRFGHAAGDTVLVAAADALKFVFRGQRVCRLGGEEFVVLLPRDQVGQTERLAREALAAIEALRFPGPLANCRISACVGWAVREDGQRIEDVIRLADRAVYEGKFSGRGKVCGAEETSTPDERDTAARAGAAF